jgi:hypothetical protein
MEALREAREALEAVRRGIDVARKARRYTTAGEADDLAIIDAAISRIDAVLTPGCEQPPSALPCTRETS